MSLEHLLALQRAHAFDPAPRRDDLHVCHVPFDELTGRNETERVLVRAIRSSERVAVIGGRGHGKSSLIAYTTGQHAEGIAPIRVSVFAESDETVRQPKAFAQHFIRTITKYATEAGLIPPERRDASLRASSDRVRILGEAIDHTRSAADVIEAAEELVAVVGSHDVLPVIVLDDTDGWLNGPGGDKTALAEAFFGRVIRMFADFPCALVVAVHEDYLAIPGFREAEGFLETRVGIPRLDGRGERALSRIFEHRSRIHGVEVPVAEVFQRGALVALADHYRVAAGNLRKVVWIAHVALQRACADKVDVITRKYIETGIAEGHVTP